MPPKAEKLLARAQGSKSGWKRNDIDRLYKAFGFIIVKGKKHDVVKHPEYPKLRATLTRASGALAKGYVQKAVSLIEQLKGLEQSED